MKLEQANRIDNVISHLLDVASRTGEWITNLEVALNYAQEYGFNGSLVVGAFGTYNITQFAIDIVDWLSSECPEYGQQTKS